MIARVSVVGVCLLGGAGCDRCGSTTTSSTEPPAVDAGEKRSARSDDPDAVADFLDGGGVESACTGAAIDIAAVIGDRQCAIQSNLARALRSKVEDAGVGSLKQEAKRTDDGKIEVRVVNHGKTGIALPLSWDPNVDAFMVLADSPTEKAVYELEAPRLDVADAGTHGPRFARVVLPPDGAMFARFAVSSRITRRVDKKDAGPLPPKLAPGKWTLHVAQLVCDVEVGEPAIVPWDIEAPH